MYALMYASQTNDRTTPFRLLSLGTHQSGNLHHAGIFPFHGLNNKPLLRLRPSLPCIPSSYLPCGFCCHLSLFPVQCSGRNLFLLQPLGYWRERWPTSDGDFVDIDWLPAEEPVKDDPRVPLVSLVCPPLGCRPLLKL